MDFLPIAKFCACLLFFHSPSRMFSEVSFEFLPTIFLKWCITYMIYCFFEYFLGIVCIISRFLGFVFCFLIEKHVFELLDAKPCRTILPQKSVWDSKRAKFDENSDFGHVRTYSWLHKWGWGSPQAAIGGTLAGGAQS